MPLIAADRFQRGGSGNSPFAIVSEQDAKLSYITVVDLAARDAIEEWKRLSFMRVHVVSTNKDYRLGADTTLAGQLWTEIATGIDSATYQVVSEKNQPDGYVGLESNGKINPVYIDNIYTNNSYVVADNTARNALTLLTGDIVTITDTSKIFVKLNDDVAPHVDADFAELVFPGAVISVNGLTGAVQITIASLLADATNLTNFNTAVANAPAVLDLDSQVLTNTVNIGNLQADVAALQAGSIVTISTWDNTENYLEGNYVDKTISGELRLFKALVNNTGLDPESTPGTWQEVGSTVSFIRTNADATLTGTRRWTFDGLEFYSTGIGDWYINNINGTVAVDTGYVNVTAVNTINFQVGAFAALMTATSLDFEVPAGGFIGYSLNRHASFSNQSFADVEYVDLEIEGANTYSDTHLITKTLPAIPTAAENGKALRWNEATELWEYFTPGATTIVTGVVNTIPYSNTDGDNFNYDSDFYYIPSRQTLVAGHDIVFSGAGLTPVGGGNTVVIGDYLTISNDHSWSAIFGSLSTLSAVFNEGIMAGGGHSLIEGPLGGNAIFGQGHAVSGASYKLYNLLAGTGHVFNTTQPGVFITNRSDGNFMFGTGNTLQGTVIKNSMVGGQLSHALGTDVVVHGYPIAGQATRPIIASGVHAVNISANSTSQTLNHGALADYSAILGGQDHNIPSDSPGSVIIGGNAIKARAADPDNVYVPYLNITQITEDTGSAYSQVIVRDSTTGKLYWRDAGTLGGGISNSGSSGQVAVTGSGGNLTGSSYFTHSLLKVTMPSALLQYPGDWYSATIPGTNADEYVQKRVMQFGGWLSMTDTSVTIYHAALNSGSGATGGSQAFQTTTDTTVFVSVIILGRRTGGTVGSAGDSAAYRLEGLFKNVAGVLTQIGTTTKTVIGESQAGWDANMSVVGTTVNFGVTDALNNIVAWNFEITVMKL